MAITCQWEDDTQKIVLVTFDGVNTWEDFYKATVEMHRMIASVDHIVHLVMIHNVELPAGNPIVHFKHANKTQPPNTGEVIVINSRMSSVSRSFLQILSTVMEKVNPSNSKIVFMGSLKEAHDYIAKHHPA